MRPFCGTAESLTLELDFLSVEDDFLVVAKGERHASAEPVTLSSALVANLAEKGEYFRRGHVQDEEAARKIGRFLFRRIFRDDIQKLFLESRSIARDHGVPLRIVLEFPPASVIQEVPWELLYDGVDFLARHPWTSIVRRIRLLQSAADLAVEPPLRVLFTSCGSAADQQCGLSLEQEVQTFRAALARAGGRVQVDVAVGNANDRPLTLQRLEGLFRRARARDRPYHVWHHAGHGSLRRRPEGPEFCLLLEGEKGEAAPTPARLISRSIADIGDLKLAVLNLCFSGSAVGLSTELARLNVPAVIGFCGAVVDPAAVELTRTLYRGLATLPLDVILTEARYAMADCKWPLEWALAVLFCRSLGSLVLLKGTPAHLEGAIRGQSLFTRIQVSRETGESDRSRATRGVQLGTVEASIPGRDFEVTFSKAEAEEPLQFASLPAEASEDVRERFRELREALDRLRAGSEEE